MNAPLTLFPGHERGELIANKVSAFLLAGRFPVEVIRPGYDSQGNKRERWTQFVVEGVPIAEVKVEVPLRTAIDKLHEMMAPIKDDRDLIGRGIEACRRQRIERWRDGVSGVETAPSINIDGHGPAEQYIS